MSRKTDLMVKKTIYQISIAILASSVVWLLFGIYTATKTPIDISVDKQEIRTLTPKLDKKTLNDLSKRRQMDKSDWKKLLDLMNNINHITKTTSKSADLKR